MLTSGPSGISPIHPAKALSAYAEHTARAESVQQGKYDSIDLSPAPVGERRSFLDVVSRLSHEVRTVNTTGDVQALAAQVRGGQYEPDAMAIASKMLLLGDV